jgi:hypothetical protein
MLLALIKSPSMVVPPFEGLLVIRHDCISHWRWRFGGTLCTGVAEFSTDVPPCAVKNSSAKRDAQRQPMYMNMRDCRETVYSNILLLVQLYEIHLFHIWIKDILSVYL